MKVLFIFGTRPEAIKLAPLINTFKKSINVKICVTGQHRHMLDQVLEVFNITPDYDLNLMTTNQSLPELSAKLLIAINNILFIERFDFVIVQGDTTTAMIGALASFYNKTKVLHVEAGLRTNNIYSPFPEEVNRQIISKISFLNFAPTEGDKSNLIKEGVNEKSIFITGNTGIDSLMWVIENTKPNIDKIPFDIKKEKYILVTGHRRENFGDGFINICEAIKSLAFKYPDIKIIYPVHLNPNVQEPVNKILSDVTNVFLIEPLDYVSFAHLMDNSLFIITDSGGVQEEAPCLGKPILVMRESTERLESTSNNGPYLVGTDKNKILFFSEKLLSDNNFYKIASSKSFPYGKGDASQLIYNILNNLS
jgi:UDP-N-acetylglucosamine 2-epimerase (non-hydrolysing)